VREAAERAVNYDEWALRKMEQDIAVAVNLATTRNTHAILAVCGRKDDVSP
jgi:hypothetical protein